MRISEAAKQLNCSPSTVRNYCHRDLLTYTLTPYSHRNINQTDINQFLGKFSGRFYQPRGKTQQQQLHDAKERLTS